MRRRRSVSALLGGCGGGLGGRVEVVGTEGHGEKLAMMSAGLCLDDRRACGSWREVDLFQGHDNVIVMLIVHEDREGRGAEFLDAGRAAILVSNDWSHLVCRGRTTVCTCRKERLRSNSC